MKTLLLNNYTIKISDEFKNKYIQFAFSREEADLCVKKSMQKNQKTDTVKIDAYWLEMMGGNKDRFIENTIEARPVYDLRNNIVCYVIIDTKDFEEYLNNNTIAMTVCDNVIKVSYALGIDKEEASEFANTYENFIRLASEYNELSKQEKELLSGKYQSLSDKDLSVIDFNPDSVWYNKNNIDGRRNLIKKCANQFLSDELNNIASPVHKIYELGFIKDEYKDINDIKTKTDMHYSFDCNAIHEKDLSARQVRIEKFLHKDEFYTYAPMKYTRTNNYRKELYSSNKTPYERNRCVYCGHVYATEYIEADHIIPVSAIKDNKGKYWKKYMERHHYTLGVNDSKNIVPACIYCNRRKGSKQGIWIFLGKIGRHKITWTLRTLAILALIVYLLISAFGQNESYYLIHLDRIFAVALIIGLWIANVNIHDTLAKKAYEKRLSQKK